jgi:hypothetical protein
MTKEEIAELGPYTWGNSDGAPREKAEQQRRISEARVSFQRNRDGIITALQQFGLNGEASGVATLEEPTVRADAVIVAGISVSGVQFEIIHMDKGSKSPSEQSEAAYIVVEGSAAISNSPDGRRDIGAVNPESGMIDVNSEFMHQVTTGFQETALIVRARPAEPAQRPIVNARAK